MNKDILCEINDFKELVKFIKKMSSATPTILFGQVVIGSPGAGKTTYCEAMARFLKALGRDVAIVNIDPANENMPYEADIGKKNIQKHHWLFFREMDLKIGSFMIKYLL